MKVADPALMDPRKSQSLLRGHGKVHSTPLVLHETTVSNRQISVMRLILISFFLIFTQLVHVIEVNIENI